MKTKNKYFLEVYTASDYLSTTLQITCQQYWNEFNNSKDYMNNHNELLDEDEKELNSYSYEETKSEQDNVIKITRIFRLGSVTVYLTQLQCKDGYCFTKRR